MKFRRAVQPLFEHDSRLLYFIDNIVPLSALMLSRCADSCFLPCLGCRTAIISRLSGPTHLFFTVGKCA